ncbi:prenyltransferase [Thalassotalea sp. Y01]|uniref:prenyltransferase n=1 Tax=Thalassotalea sp. Y01 TaxID=2729613 RepID=UPI00145F9848|nr:prenyltransferase [Thalassotalea sp. Y01]NMP16390.1 prenyltransferase [Thalassotalea sp. Y01]
MRQPIIYAVWQSCRPAFLTLTLFCVLLAYAVSYWQQIEIHYVHLALVLLAALAAHISVNTLNEYQDFQSGLDLHTERTPFSGGSGALPACPDAAPAVFKLALFNLTLCAAIGLYFVIILGWQLLIPGLIGLIIIISYTKYINKLPIICLLAPGIGFGLLMVGGSFWALTQQLNAASMVVAIVTALLVSNLLLVNQIPDASVDKRFGRHHAVIAFGVKKAVIIYALFIVFVAALICWATRQLWLPRMTLLALLPLLAGVECLRHLRRYVIERANTRALDKALGLNVVVANVTPLMLAICLLLAKPPA